MANRIKGNEITGDEKPLSSTGNRALDAIFRYEPLATPVVTRSAEVRAAIAAVKHTTGLFWSPKQLAELKTVWDYIAQLEASQPKPQSDEGLREAIKQLKYMVDGAEGRLDDVARRFAGYALASVEHVLSQAPVPTSSAVGVAEKVADVFGFTPFKKYKKQAAAIIQQATQDAHAAGVQHGLDIGAERQPPAADGKLREAE